MKLSKQITKEWNFPALHIQMLFCVSSHALMIFNTVIFQWGFREEFIRQWGKRLCPQRYLLLAWFVLWRSPEGEGIIHLICTCIVLNKAATKAPLFLLMKQIVYFLLFLCSVPLWRHYTKCFLQKLSKWIPPVVHTIEWFSEGTFFIGRVGRGNIPSWHWGVVHAGVYVSNTSG